jgi:hypothetical protein
VYSRWLSLRKIKEQGVDEDNQQQAFFMKQMEDLVNQVEQMGEEVDGSPDSAKTAFFNATISSPFGSEVMNQNNDGKNGNANPPPEFVRRAIQDAMTGVIDRLAQMSSSTNNGSGIPMNVARAFSQVLSNENLRRGIAENLSRAAPALIDPRCQGVMLSVYVPPAVAMHPNLPMPQPAPPWSLHRLSGCFLPFILLFWCNYIVMIYIVCLVNTAFVKPSSTKVTSQISSILIPNSLQPRN